MFSIIIPNFNRQNSVIKAIKSVLNQTFADFELIVVDDCSTDNSLKEISKIKDERIKVYQLEENSGAAAARNYGIKKSSGDFISFLDSDDTFEPDFLKISYETLSNSDKNTGFMWTGSNIYQGGKIDKQIWRPKREETPNLTFLKELKIGSGAGVTVKSEVFEKCGHFDERLPAAEDTDFFLRITKSYDYIYAPLYLINIYRDDNDRMSKNFKNIADAYNIFLPSYFSVIDRDKNLQGKFYYKMMWLNYNLADKKTAKYFYNKIPKSLRSFKIKIIKALYEYLPLKNASYIHQKLSS